MKKVGKWFLILIVGGLLMTLINELRPIYVKKYLASHLGEKEASRSGNIANQENDDLRSELLCSLLYDQARGQYPEADRAIFDKYVKYQDNGTIDTCPDLSSGLHAIFADLYFKSGMEQEFLLSFNRLLSAGNGKFIMALSEVHGTAYLLGLEGVEQDFEKAEFILSAGAEFGGMLSAKNLGIYKMYGIDGFPKDARGGYLLLRKAADSGDSLARYYVAEALFDGSGVTRNYAEAAKLANLAARQGETKAQVMIGLMYAKGQGVKQDAVASYAWFLVAKASGNEDADKHIIFIEEIISDDEIRRGQQLADTLMGQISPPRSA